MIVTDSNGDAEVRTKKELERRLTLSRDSRHGAFILTHKKGGPSLWIHLCNTVAYLHFFPDPDYLIHAGYQPTGMTPPGCEKQMTFQVVAGDSITVPAGTLVSLPEAIIAAKEFFDDPVLPASITWLEL